MMKMLVILDRKFLLLMITLILSCNPEVQTPGFHKDGLSIVFNDENWSDFHVSSKKTDESRISQIAYSAFSNNVFVSITQVEGLYIYENLQKGNRMYCPPEILQAFPKDFRMIPSYTEVLNDTTYLIGSIWSVNMDRDEEALPFRAEDTYGWHFALLNPKLTTFIDIWKMNRNSISIDSLFNQTYYLRNQFTIIIDN